MIASKTISIHNYVFMDIIVSKAILSREIPIGESADSGVFVMAMKKVDSIKKVHISLF